MPTQKQMITSIFKEICEVEDEDALGEDATYDAKNQRVMKIMRNPAKAETKAEEASEEK